MGINTDGDYMVDPDGFGLGEAAVLVSCNMTGRNGQAETMVSHNSEAKTLVDGYEGKLSYERDVRYSIAKSQILALIMLSDHCEQFIRYDCHKSVFWRVNATHPYAAWESRSGKIVTYWGGAVPGSGMCACGMTQSCDKPNGKCNCDRNDKKWRFDEGYLTDKETLPVTKMFFGDAGGVNEKGYHTLGKLICYETKI